MDVFLLNKEEQNIRFKRRNNAIYIKMKNDVSFIIDSNMCLFEHQSSYCPNMPLRGFLYFADLYKKHIRDVELIIITKIKATCHCIGACFWLL